MHTQPATVRRHYPRPATALRVQPPFFHARNQERGGISFPLDVTDGASSSERQVASKFESPVAGAEGQDVAGTWSHMKPPMR